MKKLHAILLPLLTLGALSVFSVDGCSGSDSSSPGTPGASADVVFHGEANALPSFSYDTGAIPPGPVNVDLQLSVAGGLTADAVGISSGPAASPTLSGKPGSGAFKIGVQFKMGGTLHAALTGLPSYDGPIPGIENVDVSFDATKAFDPFLIGGKVTATANVPETKLPAIPLPGGIPGDLQITILAGSTLSSDFSGKCASVTAGPNAQGHYVGEATTSGTLKIQATIEIQVPLVGSKSFDAPPFDVPIPPTPVAIDLGTKPVPGGGSAAPGASVASGTACGMTGAGGGSTSGGGGAGPTSTASTGGPGTGGAGTSGPGTGGGPGAGVGGAGTGGDGTGGFGGGTGPNCTHCASDFPYVPHGPDNNCELNGPPSSLDLWNSAVACVCNSSCSDACFDNICSAMPATDACNTCIAQFCEAAWMACQDDM